MKLIKQPAEHCNDWVGNDFQGLAGPIVPYPSEDVYIYNIKRNQNKELTNHAKERKKFHAE